MHWELWSPLPFRKENINALEIMGNKKEERGR
jgi:hypothetical protein